MGFFGSFIEQELEQAEDKVRSRSKGKVRESAIKQARMRVLRMYGIQAGGTESRQFADPALMM